MSLGTINWCLLIQQPLDKHQRRNPMPLHIILYRRAVPVMNGGQHISTQTRMWLIFWLSLWLVQNELILFKWYYIIMFDTWRGEDYDGFKRIRTSTCSPSRVSIRFFLIFSQWGFTSFLDFPIFPSGVYGFILHSCQMGWSLLVWCLVCNPSGYPIDPCFGLRGVLNGTVSRVQAYSLVRISTHTCEYEHDTII